MDVIRRATHRTRVVAVLVLPSGSTGASPVDWVAGRPVGTHTRLVAAQPPGSTGAGDGAVDPLPSCTHTHAIHPHSDDTVTSTHT